MFLQIRAPLAASINPRHIVHQPTSVRPGAIECGSPERKEAADLSPSGPVDELLRNV